MTHDLEDCADPMVCVDHCAHAQFRAIEAELTEIKETLAFIKATIVKADTTIATVAEQVMPTINELKESPMLKMLGVGRKK